MIEFLERNAMLLFFLIAGAMVLRVVWLQMRFNREMQHERELDGHGWGE